MPITLYSIILIIFVFIYYFFAYESTSWQISVQDLTTPYMEGILNFHNIIMFFIVVSLIFVFWLLFKLYNKKLYPSFENFTHSEVVWIIFSVFILTVIIFILLDSLDYSFNSSSETNLNGKKFLSASYSYCDSFEKKIIKLGKDDFSLLDCSPNTRSHNFIMSNKLDKEGIFVFYDSVYNIDVFVFNLDSKIIEDMYSILTGLTEISGVKDHEPYFVCVLVKKNFLDTLASLRDDIHFYSKREDDLDQPALNLEPCNKFPLLEVLNSDSPNSLIIIYNEYYDSYLFQVCLDKEHADRFYSISTGYSKINGNKVTDSKCLCFKTDPKFIQLFLKEN